MTSLRRTLDRPAAASAAPPQAARRAGRIPWAEAAALAAVLALAAALRLGWPGVHTWSYDEARVALLALETARGGDVAAVGIQSSAGLPNLPAAVWLYALPLAVSPDPLVASLWTGAVNVLAVAGLWWLVRRPAGPWAGLTAAALWAGAPFAAFYSRAIWSQDLLGPLAVLWALLGVRAARGSDPADRVGSVALAAHILIAGLAPQVHFAGAALLPPTLWLAVRYRWWRRPWPLVAGVVLATVAALPYVVALWRADALLGTIQAALAGAGGEAGSPRELVGMQRLLEMGVGRGWEWFLLGGEWQWAEGWAVALRVASVGAGILLLLGAAALALRPWRGRGRTPEPLSALLPAWLLGAPLLFLGHLTPAYHQYQLAALPALFALGGYGAALLPRRKAWGPTALALAFGVAAVQGAGFGRGLGIVAERLTPGGIGTPLAYPRAAVGALGEGEVIVHAHGDDAAAVGDVAGFEALLWGRPHRVVDGRAVLLVPGTDAAGDAKPAHLLFTFGDLPAWDLAEGLDLPGERLAHPRREGEPTYLSLTPAGVAPAGMVAVDSPRALANGAALAGWRIERLGEALRVVTQWRLAEPAPEGARYHGFHHLYVGEGSEPDAVHDVPLSSAAWRAGDTLYVVADLPAPPEGAYHVEVGMYTYPDITRVSPEVVLRLEADQHESLE